MNCLGHGEQKLNFVSAGTTCAATLYLPTSISKPPVVVMAHGFAGEQSFRLPAYARLFASRGLAVLVFDYRHLGDSEGRPRHLVSYRRQLADWKAAVGFARELASVDGSRIALWGSSYSGGHVLVIGAVMRGISAIVSQAPMVDVPGSTKRTDTKFKLSCLWHASLDLAKSALCRTPHYVKVVGSPDQFAVMNRPGCLEGYLSLIPRGVEWQNRCAARELFWALFYRPIKFADRVQCPVQLVMAETDQLIPRDRVEKTADRLPCCDFVRWPGDHFSVYHGEAFDKLAPMQADFLSTHLVDNPARASTPAPSS